MSQLLINHEEPGGDWHVWLGLDDDVDPSTEGLGFIIGSGSTRGAAIAAAIVDTHATLHALQTELERSHAVR